MTLAERQAELVRALVGGGPLPPGFATADLTATRAALMRKRAAEVALVWPALAESFSGGWRDAFGAWAHGRPPRGSLRDGWDFARSLPELGEHARRELCVREILWRYNGKAAPVKRRLPTARRLSRGQWIAQVAGRVFG